MWEEGTLPDDMEHMVTFMKHTGNWKCLRCVFEVPYNPSWGVMSGAIIAHYKEQHPDAMPNAPAPQGRCADHCVGAQELVIRQQQQRLSNLSNDATADQAVFAHIHKILDESQVPRSQKIEGQKHSVWLTTPRRVEWLVENIAARSMHLNEAVQDAVARNIDLVKYNGKTIREWIVLSNTLQQQLAQKDKRIAELEGGM